jgi:serine/threonine protein kinase
MNTASIHDYRLGRELFSDSLASTMEARGPKGPVRIHLLHAHLETDPVILQSFLSEYRSYAELDHPGLPAVYSVIEGPPAVICAPRDWEALPEAPPAGFAELARYLQSLAGILDYAHGQGLVFRDLAPSSLGIRADGTAVITDAPRGRIRDVLSLSSSTMMSARMEFLAPEVLYGDNCDPRSDLYSLGRISRSLLGGATGIPAPEWFLVLIDRLCADIESRPGSAEEVLQILISQTRPEPEPRIPCFSCLEEYPAALPICPACGKTPPVIKREHEYGDGESLVLRKISEREEILSPFIQRLRALSGDPDFSVNILTGDIRMYGKAEKEAGKQLPMIIMNRLSASECTELISALESGKKSEIHLERYPAGTRKKFKSGPVIREIIRPSIDPSMLEDANRIRSRIASDQGEQKRPGLELLMKMLGSLSRDVWEEPETLVIRDRIQEIDRQLADLSSVLESLNLGDIYNRINSINRRISRSENTAEISALIDDKTQLVEAFSRFRTAERQKTRLLRELSGLEAQVFAAKD